MPPLKYLKNLAHTAEIGKKIYDERYRQLYEPAQNGMFLVIDLESGNGRAWRNFVRGYDGR